ncbi:hypothetical protein GGR51DRAFT_556406 [Nemania sp. FL0031]|nr:hypothetical protein GGR51DRAFT_556406 [Nemania sp. FL0031]
METYMPYSTTTTDDKPRLLKTSGDPKCPPESKTANSLHTRSFKALPAFNELWLERASVCDVAGQSWTPSVNNCFLSPGQYPPWSTSSLVCRPVVSTSPSGDVFRGADLLLDSFHTDEANQAPAQWYENTNGLESLGLAPQISIGQMLPEYLNVLPSVPDSFLSSGFHTPFSRLTTATTMIDQQANSNFTGLTPMGTDNSGRIQPIESEVPMPELISLDFGDSEMITSGDNAGDLQASASPKYGNHAEMFAPNQICETQPPLTSGSNTALEAWLHEPPSERVPIFARRMVFNDNLVRNQVSESAEYGLDASRAGTGSNNGPSYSTALTPIVTLKQLLTETFAATYNQTNIRKTKFSGRYQ